MRFVAVNGMRSVEARISLEGLLYAVTAVEACLQAEGVEFHGRAVPRGSVIWFTGSMRATKARSRIVAIGEDQIIAVIREPYVRTA